MNWVNNTNQFDMLVTNSVADLAVMISGSPSPVVVNYPLTYVMTVSNLGPQTAIGASLTNSLFATDELISATPSNYVIIGQKVIWPLGDIPAGGKVTVTAVIRPKTLGSDVGWADVGALTPDPVLSNNTSQVLVPVVAPTPSVVGAGYALTAQTPYAHNSIVPGQPVTVQFALRNVGTANTTNLMARLLAINGVQMPTVGIYGILQAAGLPVSRPFTFTVNTTNTTADLVLELTDRNGLVQLGYVTNTVPVSSIRTYAMPSIIFINDNAVANPYPSTIMVSNMNDTVTKVSVTISNLNHANGSDVNMLLVGPQGQKVGLMGHSGMGYPVENATITFDDDATDNLPGSFTPIVSGTYKPTFYSPAVAFPGGAPDSLYASSMAVFSGMSANGEWSLYVLDDLEGGDGRIENGWSISFVTVRTLPTWADVAVSATVTPSLQSVNENVTIAVSATNLGPANATGVVLTNVLPAGFRVVSTVPTRGSVTRVTSASGDTLICNLAGMTNGEVFRLITVGYMVTGGNTQTKAGISAIESDPNLANNFVSVPVNYTFGYADLILGATIEPTQPIAGMATTIRVRGTNLGPATATGVVISNLLSTNFYFLSAYSSKGTNSHAGGLVVFPVGSLTNMEECELTIVGIPTLGGIQTNLALLTANQTDPNPSNNISVLAYFVQGPKLTVERAEGSMVKVIWNRLVSYDLQVSSGLETPVYWELVDPSKIVVGPVYKEAYFDLDEKGNEMLFFRLAAPTP